MDEQDAGTRNRRSSLRDLVGLMVAHKKALGVGFAALILVDLIQLDPRITQSVIDHLAQGTATPEILGPRGGIVGSRSPWGFCFCWLTS
jgi:hypothetical protein